MAQIAARASSRLSAMHRPATTSRPPARAALVCRAAQHRDEERSGSGMVATSVVLGALASASVLLDAGAALASGRDRVSEFEASGLLFKDVIEVTAVEDPEIAGVTIYFSDFKRNIVDKLSKDFFAEPSQASLTCVVTGPVTIKDEKRVGRFEGAEVFSEQKGLNIFKNKTLRVRRVYDAERRTVLYIAYSTRLSTASDEGGVSTGRYKTSMCAVSLPQPAPAPPVAVAAPVATTAAAPAGGDVVATQGAAVISAMP
ncbi:hypothetical protein HYH03_019209 [Edaphochlamys debaryana]|uniref:CreA n=1 Tax=Edaphochlamys debaryana TaxID=47281 RepID=A0A836BME4_9CHLO|nr:hypothetical protein HYH03_019209 [Edaphochlamys debaryana]|eukprot:KAG2481825.1 hypothetical protein HYH03_019209 [Edaphochlamys debaryana]